MVKGCVRSMNRSSFANARGDPPMARHRGAYVTHTIVNESIRGSYEPLTTLNQTTTILISTILFSQPTSFYFNYITNVKFNIYSFIHYECITSHFSTTNCIYITFMCTKRSCYVTIFTIWI